MDLTWHEGAVLAIHIAMGVGLAACAGLRAFLPLFVVGLSDRLFEGFQLSQSFQWLSSWPALIVFGAAVVTEIAGDKFPGIDNFLDTFQTFVKPVAGAMVMASVVTDWSPLYVTIASIIGGGSIAGLVHLTKAKLRLASSVTTVGAANPVLSAGEDVGAVAISVASLVAPFFVAGVVVVAVSAAWWAFVRLTR